MLNKQVAKAIIEQSLANGGIRKAQLAARLAMSPSAVSRKIGARYPHDRFTESEVRKIVAFLHLDPDEGGRLLRAYGYAASGPSPSPEQSAAPPLIAPFARSPWPNNLPACLTSFIGREQEMAELRRLLGISRLVTLTGPGGAGKTRLALETSADLLGHYRNGVWLAELAALTDPLLVPHAVAGALGVREAPRRPLIDSIADFVASRHLLILLDNCEHVLDACVRLVDALLRACPTLQILATSRERLRLAGETVWSVPTLAHPGHWYVEHVGADAIETLLEFDAVRLFLERARAARPDFSISPLVMSPVVHICARLDGIPLALELAAARVDSLTTDEIAAGLDDRFALLTEGNRAALPRQQTLRATLDWSYALLSEPEQAVFRRLAVFAGRFTPEACEAVCVGGPVHVDTSQDLLLRIVDKSLVMVERSGDQTRFRLLETVRDYAHARLEEANELADAANRHRDWYLALAAEVKPGMLGPDAPQWFARLENERDNFNAALTWSVAQGNAAAAHTLVDALFRFWATHGPLTEGRRWARQALALGGPPSLDRARSLVVGANLAREQGDYAEAMTLSEEGLAVSRAIDHQVGIALMLNGMGIIARIQGDYDRAAALSQEALTLRRGMGDRRGMAGSLENLGNTAWNRGDYVRAAGFLEQSLAIWRGLDDQRSVAMSLSNLGSIATSLKEYRRATALFDEALSAFRELGDKPAIVDVLTSLGKTRRLQGDLIGASAALVESLGAAREIGDPMRLAATLQALAFVAGRRGQPAHAARLHGAAGRLREDANAPVPLVDQEDHNREVVFMRNALSAGAFTTAWSEGRAMSLEQAIALAVQELR